MNYKKVIKDFNSGKIDKSKFRVVMDNDGGYWECLDDTLTEDTRNTLVNKMSDKYGNPEGYHDMVDVLIEAGVNAKWC